jgi:hypothetical protein
MGAIQMVPMAHKIISRYKRNKQLTNFQMDMMGKERVSQRAMEYTFIINRPNQINAVVRVSMNMVQGSKPASTLGRIPQYSSRTPQYSSQNTTVFQAEACAIKTSITKGVDKGYKNRNTILLTVPNVND